MAALTSAQHAFMFLWIIGSLAAGETLEKNATSGENVTLQCSSSTDAAITKLEWKRPELEDEYVFLFKNNKPFDNNQDPRYQGRVELKDLKMKNGDASVLLKNVSINDSGTYECWVLTSQTRRRRAADEKPVASVHLIVSEGSEKEIKNEHHQYGDANDEQPGGPRGNVRLGVGLALLFVGVGVGVCIIRRFVKSQKAKRKRAEESFDEEEEFKENTGQLKDLFTPDCPPSPASKLNHLLPESLP